MITDTERKALLLSVIRRENRALKELARDRHQESTDPDARVTFIASLLPVIGAGTFVLDENLVPRKKKYQLYALARLLNINVEIARSNETPGLQVADFIAGALKHANESWDVLVLKGKDVKIVYL